MVRRKHRSERARAGACAVRGLILAALASACTASETQPSDPADSNDRAAPVDGLGAMAQIPGAEAVAVAEDGVPRFVTGALARVPPATMLRSMTEADLRPVLDGLTPMFRLDSAELRLARVSRDRLGAHHVRYRQEHAGLEVVGGELIVHLSADGTVYAVNGSARHLDDVPIATISAESALAGLATDAAYAGRTLGAPRLVYVVSSQDQRTHLAWEILVEGENDDEPSADLIYVDAQTGKVADIHPLIHTARVRRVYDAKNGIALPGALRRAEGEAGHSDLDVNAAYDNAGSTYDCYRTLFNRDGIDDAGMMIASTIHYATRYNNAFWNGSQMVYGDGDGTAMVALARSLDVTAHEITHGITAHESKLIYHGESGALNEAMSDIFGAVCETWSKAGGIPNANTWKMGEEIYTPKTAGDALRYMDDPTADGISFDYYPERYTGSADSGGVHLNSGIANLAFYLMSEGGHHPRGKTSTVVTGIGLAKAAQIWYRANSVYLTASANFSAARVALVQAARDLYPGEPGIEQTVEKAWTAVGVAAPPPPPPLVVLANGAAQTGVSGPPDRQYAIDVPAGSSNLVIDATGSNGDADIYVRFGAEASEAVFDYKSDGSTSAENVLISEPQTGRYYIQLKAYTHFTGLTIKASYQVEAPPPTPGGTALSSGVPKTGLSGAKSSMAVYTLRVPSGASQVTFATSGGTGDADLYIKFGAAPTISSYDQRSLQVGNSDSLTLVAPAPGTYYVMLHGYAAYTGVSLTGTIQLGMASYTELANKVQITGVAGASRSSRLYQIVVPSGASRLTFAIAGGTGDADLYVQFGAAPTLTSYDYRPSLSGNNERVTATTEAGVWYVMVYGYLAYSNLSITASYDL